MKSKPYKIKLQTGDKVRIQSFEGRVMLEIIKVNRLSYDLEGDLFGAKKQETLLLAENSRLLSNMEFEVI